MIIRKRNGPAVSVVYAVMLCAFASCLTGFAQNCPGCIHGSCSGGSCICDTNWFGDNCTTFVCDVRRGGPCLNGGTCSQGEEDNFVCSCPEGYQGTLCDCVDGALGQSKNNLCLDLSRCGEHGTCVIDSFTGNETCVCAAGWGGDECSKEVNYCLSRGCKNGGTCTLTNDFFNCSCPVGYNYVDQCSRPFYDSCYYKPCENGGTCSLPVPHYNKTYICHCPPGYTGINCSVPFSHCDSNPCLNNGNCSELSDLSGYQCICPPYYTGINCQTEINPCQGKSCFNKGVCSSSYIKFGGKYNYSTSCNCSKGFTGSQCETDIDECLTNNLCHNGATCINRFGSYLCLCQRGFAGEHCDININDCDPNPCQNGGVCRDGDNSYTCDCSQTSFTGQHCQVHKNQTCLIQGCYFGGQCNNSSLHQPTCTCQTGFTGDLCLFKFQPCMENGCYINGTSHCDISGTKCVCRPGFTGSLCDTIMTDPCAGSPCGHNATCTKNGSDFECHCPLGVTGKLCDNHLYNTCQGSLSCVNNGTCIRHLNSEYCLCPSGWGGKDCSYDIDECSQTPCHNGGTCIDSDGSYACSCPANFTGKHCDVILGSCDSIECQNGGSCVWNDTIKQSVCNCRDEYKGTFCETEVCPYANCSQLANNGKCDWHCFTKACNFDGGKDQCFTNNIQPWANCSDPSYCRYKYNNGYCDQECNNALCLFDGNDCDPPSTECPSTIVDVCSEKVNDGTCDELCNTPQCHIDIADCGGQVYLPGTLVLILVSNADVQFNEDTINSFEVALGRLIHARADVVRYSEITLEELTRGGYNTNIIPLRDSIGTDIKYWKVIIRVDIQYCQSACPTSMRQVLKTIEAAYSTGHVKIANFGVVDAASQGPTTTDNSSSNGAGKIALYVSIPVGVILLLIAVIVLGKRVRDNGGIKETIKKIKVRRTWQIPGSTPEPDSSPQTRDPSFSERRSSSMDTIIESSPRSQRRSGTHFTWNPIEVAVSSGSNGGSVAVIGEKAKDSRKWTPLHCEAVNHHSSSNLKELLSTSDINAKGPGGMTPLMIAIISEDKEQTSKYKLRPAGPVRSDSSSESEHSEHDAFLISRSPKLFHHRQGMMFSSAHCASHSRVTLFITPQTDLNIPNDRGQTALHLAAKHGREDYIQLLLQAKADPNVQDMWGQSPIHVTIGAAADRAFEVLVEYPKTSLELKSLGGITPLIMAVKMANQSMLNQLIAKNVDISGTDNEGRTAVHWAAMINNVEALKILITKGPDNIKDAPNGRGETALFLACREGSAASVKYLLENYANATLLDSLDKSPLQIAFERQHGDIVEMLHQANQTPNLPPPLYNEKLPQVSLVNIRNPMFNRGGSIKLEPGMSHVPPAYPQSLSNGIPVGMSLPHYPQRDYSQSISTTAGPSITTYSIPRIPSIEAELDSLVSSTLSYPFYNLAQNPRLFYTTSHHTLPPPVSQDQNVSLMPNGVNMMDGNQTSPGQNSSDGVSPGVSIHHDHITYSPSNSTSPSMYPISNQSTPTAVHMTTAQDLATGSQPLQHLPYEVTPSIQPVSTSIDHSHQPGPYNTALQSINHSQLPGGHSPPLAQTVSPNPPLTIVPAQQSGFSPQQVVTAENQSPLSGYHGFPSPPKEAGEYPFSGASCTYPSDIINSLTPSPEDYSAQHPNEGSPPQQQQQATINGHYVYAMQPHYDFQTHIPGISVTFNAPRHESTV